MADPTPKLPPAPPPPNQVAKDDDVIERRTLRDYYIILRERLWIALPLALLVSVGWGYLKMQAPPRYHAHATMEFEKPDTILTTVGVVDQSMRSDADLNTNLARLRSERLQKKVLESFTPGEKIILQRAALKRQKPGATGSVGLPLGTVVPSATHNSFIINIDVDHDDPEAAALVANRYVEKFMDYLRENAGGKNEDAVEYLQNQAARLKAEAEAADAKLNQYVKENQLGLSLDSSQNMIADRLKLAATKQSEADSNVRLWEDAVQQLEQFKSSGRNILEISSIASYGSVPSHRAKLDELRREQDALADRYLERHPKMIAIASNIATTEEQLKVAEDSAIASIKTKLEEAQKTLQTFTEQYKKAEEESLRLRELSVPFQSLRQDAETAKNAYMAINARLADTKTTKELDASKLPLHPLDAATAPSEPYSPNPSAITRTCVGLGIMIFLGVAVGLSFVDDRIKSAWDVESFIGANLLGIIPDLGSVKDEEKYSLLLENKQAPGVEAFLSVYSSIKIHSKLDFPKSILVTSTIPGEGKTLISCNVAGSFARHGKKTLLIDCDLRRPMLHRHFKQQNNAGLITWFEGGAAMEGDLATNLALGIIKVGENLSLLCSGGRSKSPTELLESPVFGQLLERLKKEYDLVIVDSPPLGAVTDSLLIAERIDEVVYVCRFNRAYRKHIRLYMRALRNGKNEVLGVVLNGLSPRRIEYYSNYRYYRSYKKYYGSQT